MELKELKEIWHTEVGSRALADKYHSQKINEIIMNAHFTLDNLHRTNIFWWTFSKISTVVLIAILALTLSLFLIDPSSYSQLRAAMPVIGIIAFCSLLTLWLYYEQAKTFDIVDAANLKAAIEYSLQRFVRFYSLFSIVNLIMFPVVFYIAILSIEVGFFHIEIIFDERIAYQSVVLALIAMAANHWYYRKKYFARFTALRNNLRELNEQNPNL